MEKLKVNTDTSERIQKFINSDLFSVKSQVAKSDYWMENSNLLKTNIAGDSIEVTGISGFYVPRKASVLQRTTRQILRAFKEPSKAVRWINNRAVSPFKAPRLLSYDKAFDAVMSHAEVSDPDLSPYRINHRKLASIPKTFMTTSSLRRHYQNWSGYEATSHIINSYYYQNILRGFIDESQISTVLEIGAGNGNFASILYNDWAPIRLILIDLPETLAIAITFLSSLFPKAKIVMPTEAQEMGHLPEQFDFAFLTVDQLNILTDNSVDLAINCHSFQEMTKEQIDIYFQLIQRVCHNSAFFFTANRIEKIPCNSDSFFIEQSAPPNRFAEYPWNPQNKILAYEISRLTRLVQLDGISMRLECICK